MVMPQWPNIISVSVVPVVIISACGLLSLAFYGRLAALVARLRTFQREMLREQENWAREGLEDQKRLLEVLRTQTLRVTERARLIRVALLFFLFRRSAADCLQPHYRAQRILSRGHVLRRRLFRVRPALHVVWRDFCNAGTS